MNKIEQLAKVFAKYRGKLNIYADLGGIIFFVYREGLAFSINLYYDG